MMPFGTRRWRQAMRARAQGNVIPFSAPTGAPAPQAAPAPATTGSYPASSFGGTVSAPTATAEPHPYWEQPEVLPADPAELVRQERDPPLSPFGRAAVGAAIGGVVTAAFELPGGPVLGAVAGGIIGYYLPRPGRGRGGRREGR
jgi:hypothetical protein